MYRDKLETPRKDLGPQSDAVFKDGFAGQATFNGIPIDFTGTWHMSARGCLEEQADMADEACRTIEDMFEDETL